MGFSLISVSLVNLALLDQQIFFFRVGDWQWQSWRPREYLIKISHLTWLQALSSGSTCALETFWTSRSRVSPTAGETWPAPVLRCNRLMWSPLKLSLLCILGKRSPLRNHLVIRYENACSCRENCFVINNAMFWFFFCSYQFSCEFIKRKYRRERISTGSIVCFSIHPPGLRSSEGLIGILIGPILPWVTYPNLIRPFFNLVFVSWRWLHLRSVAWRWKVSKLWDLLIGQVLTKCCSSHGSSLTFWATHVLPSCFHPCIYFSNRPNFTKQNLGLLWPLWGISEMNKMDHLRDKLEQMGRKPWEESLWLLCPNERLLFNMRDHPLNFFYFSDY